MKILPFRLRGLSVLAASFLLALAARAGTVDFNTSTDLATYFNNAGPSGSGVNQVTSGGLGGSGALNVNQGTGQATTVLYTTSFDGTGGSITTLTQSVYFQWTTNTTLSNQPLLLVLTGDVSNQLTTATPSAYVGGGITASATTNVVQFAARAWDGTTATTSQYATNITLTAGNWYFLTVTYTLGTTWTMDLSLSNADSTGVVGTLLGSLTVSNIATALSSDSSIYAGMRIVNGSGTGGLGVDVLDNYTITTTSSIPEPSTYAILLAVAALAAGCLFRKRCRD